MSLPILVTGGTGTLGRLVVPHLLAEGHDVRVLSRRPHQNSDGVEYVTGDLFRDEGTDAAVDGIETVLHLAGGPKGDDVATRSLVRAAAGAKVGHLVYVSVTGADRIPVAWMKMKLAAERAVENSGMPWTTLRAAQFHDLALTVLSKMAKSPAVPVLSRARFEPVDTADVADRLVELTLGEPAGLVPDLGGPRVYEMGELVTSYLTARGKHRLRMPIRMPGKIGRLYRDGANLARPGADRGTRTWEDFLTERVSRAGG